MPVSLNILSHAAPLIVEAANAIFSKIRKNKEEQNLKDQVSGQDEKIVNLAQRQHELFSISEEQNVVIKTLAEQNEKLITAVRNIKYISIVAISLALISLVLGVLF